MVTTAFVNTGFGGLGSRLEASLSTCGPRCRPSRVARVSMTAAKESSPAEAKESPAAAAAERQGSLGLETLPLTMENVETVLDEVRPYLISDGGNVSIADIDGATVRLKLEGACGSCPSSTMTMRMGIERRLLERIPEIEAVEQAMDEGPEITEENVDRILGEVRPFLNVAGGTIHLDSLSGIDSSSPVAKLKMTGAGAAIQSVKVEITQRLRRNFPALGQVVFVD